MSDQPPSSMIEWIFAAPLLGISAALGASIKWIWDRVMKARATREAKIEAREHEYVKKLEARIEELEKNDHQRARENRALWVAFEIVASEVRRDDPDNPELKRAELILTKAFGVSVDKPADIISTLAKM